MKGYAIRHIGTFLLVCSLYIHAERVYNVEKVIIPEYRITVQNRAYTQISSEIQTFDTQWKNKKKTYFLFK